MRPAEARTAAIAGGYYDTSLQTDAIRLLPAEYRTIDTAASVTRAGTVAA